MSNIDFLKDENVELNLTAEVESLYFYFSKNAIDYNKFNLNDVKAYPNYEKYVAIPGTHNLQKWVSALKEILFLEKNGSSRSDSIKKITSSWKPMEVYDFLNWIKFYQNNDHLKYSQAQYLPGKMNNVPNYFLKLKNDGELEDKKDIDFAMSNAANSMSLSEKKRIIEKQRNKIISRLDSAEKLLRTDEGEMFAGNELESLIHSIYELKKKIGLVNKLSIATRLYEDMILREANVLYSRGQINSSNFLKRIVADANESSLMPAAAAPPTVSSGSPGGLPSMGPGMPQTPGQPEQNNNPDLLVEMPPEIEVEDDTAGITGFLNNLNSGGLTDAEELDENELDVNNLLITEAQAMPPAAAPKASTPEAKPPTQPQAKPVAKPVPSAQPVPGKTPTPAKPNENKDLSVKEDDSSPSEGDAAHKSNIDTLINNLFSNVKVSDVIEKLEDLSTIFNTREVPRQLAIVDMMLDTLGLATFFPQLSEATNKALDSNNYIATRIDDILMKLRSNMYEHSVDLKGEDTVQSPEAKNVMENLKDDAEKTQKRREMRKMKEDKKLEDSVLDDAKEEAEVDLGDLENPKPATPAKPPLPAVPSKV